MKTFKTLLVIIVFICSTSVINAQVGIGTITPEGALDITSTTDGLLIPRVALADTGTATVITPTESELVYNTSLINDVTPGFYYYSAAGTWVRFGGSGWLTDGNSGTNATTNFMGTLDNVDVAFRRNNLAAGRISATSTSFGLGAQATAPSSAGITAIGYNALTSNTAGGILNTAVGFRALVANSTGDNNTAVGWETLLNNNGEGNTAVGGAALNRNIGGNFNTAVGHVALYFNTGSQSTAVGYRALVSNTSGTNTALGYLALEDNNIGTNNTAVGNSALLNNTTGQFNVAMGSLALAANTTTRFNIAIGHTALTANRGERNIAMGHEALSRINNGSAQDNVAIGYQSMDFAAGIANRNIAIGAGTLRFVNGGTQNVAVGHDAGSAITSGNNNIAIGISAQVPSATASNQISIGNLIYGSLGNIGIGMNAPATRLQVAGTITSTGITVNGLSTVTGAATAASLTATGAVTSNTLNVTGAATSASLTTTGGVTSTALTVNGLATANNLEVSGNIGIGIVAPTEKLEVNGKIRAVDVNFSGLLEYADEAAAVAGAILTTGDLYKTPTGEIRIKL